MSSAAEAAARLHRLSPSIWLPPQIQELAENPEKKIFGSEGMVWYGNWDREEGYPVQATVRYKGKVYVCIEPVAAVSGITGLGPNPGVVKSKNWAFPEGRKKPIGRLAPNEPFGGILRRAPNPKFPENAQFQEYNTNLEDPEKPGIQPIFVAQVWEFWVKEGTRASFSGFGNYEGHNGFWGPNIVHGTIGDDGATNQNSNMASSNGTLAETSWEKIEAFKIGGNERYYLVVYGGTWKEEGPLPHQKMILTLPQQYELTPNGNIIAGPGNLPPSQDTEHWMLAV